MLAKYTRQSWTRRFRLPSGWFGAPYTDSTGPQCGLQVGTANGVTDSVRIVQEILNEVVANVVEILHSLVIVQEILKACLERIDYSKLVEKKKDIPSRLAQLTSGIGRTDGKLVKNNALSVVNSSVLTQEPLLHDAIKKITFCARSQGEASSPDVVRMDFVTLEKDRVAHRGDKEPFKPQRSLETKAIPHSDLSYRGSPTLLSRCYTCGMITSHSTFQWLSTSSFRSRMSSLAQV